MLTKPPVSYNFCVSVPFHIYLPWVNVFLANCLNSVLNVKAVVATFNQEKALQEEVIVKSSANLRLKL